jgi:hypothetical protein
MIGEDKWDDGEEVFVEVLGHFGKEEVTTFVIFKR